MVGRRALVLAAIVGAGFASIATSPMPTQAPSLTDELTGELALSARQPAVAVEIEVVGNAALMADQATSAQVAIRRAAPAGDVGAPAFPVLISIEALAGRRFNQFAEAWDSFQESLDQVCPGPGECTRRYRLTALLADPSAVEGEVAVTWTAVAEARTGTQEQPAPAPPGGQLTLRADDPVALAAGEHLTATTAPAEQRLDVDHPRVVQDVTLTRAGGMGTAEGPGFGLQLRVDTVNDADPERTGWSFRVDGTTARSTGPAAGTIGVELLPCEDLAGCTDVLTVIGDWVGGDPAGGETVRWSLAAAAFGRGDEATIPQAGSIGLVDHDAIVAVPHEAATASGKLSTGGRDSSRRNVRVVVDGAVPDGAEALFLVQPTLRAETRGPSGADGEVRLAVAGASARGPAGDDLAATAQAIPLDCTGGPCQAAFQIEASGQQYPAGSVEVAWELTIALATDVAVDFGPGLSVDIEVTEPPD